MCLSLKKRYQCGLFIFLGGGLCIEEIVLATLHLSANVDVLYCAAYDIDVGVQ